MYTNTFCNTFTWGLNTPLSRPLRLFWEKICAVIDDLKFSHKYKNIPLFSKISAVDTPAPACAEPVLHDVETTQLDIYVRGCDGLTQEDKPADDVTAAKTVKDQQPTSLSKQVKTINVVMFIML